MAVKPRPAPVVAFDGSSTGLADSGQVDARPGDWIASPEGTLAVPARLADGDDALARAFASLADAGQVKEPARPGVVAGLTDARRDGAGPVNSRVRACTAESCRTLEAVAQGADGEGLCAQAGLAAGRRRNADQAGGTCCDVVLEDAGLPFLTRRHSGNTGRRLSRAVVIAVQTAPASLAKCVARFFIPSQPEIRAGARDAGLAQALAKRLARCAVGVPWLTDASREAAKGVWPARAGRAAVFPVRDGGAIGDTDTTDARTTEFKLRPKRAHHRTAAVLRKCVETTLALGCVKPHRARVDRGRAIAVPVQTLLIEQATGFGREMLQTAGCFAVANEANALGGVVLVRQTGRGRGVGAAACRADDAGSDKAHKNTHVRLSVGANAASGDSAAASGVRPRTNCAGAGSATPRTATRWPTPRDRARWCLSCSWRPGGRRRSCPRASRPRR